ncbi:MAG: type II secretion system protein [Candidatus Shapirobacteria bacterium]|nr:type II secretion system protein [Candidatus Shapirobacteria bacterium]
MKNKINKLKGFTLVELLIVIALISILSVAVLATINPIEQSNKAKDSTVQNDAAEVMNSYERYYANAQAYPWQLYGSPTKPSVEDAVLLRSDSQGFGLCDEGDYNTSASVATTCSVNSSTPGELIKSDELKTAFVGKDEFRTVATNDENGLWLYKQAGSGGGIYVCYVPKAKSNRNPTNNQLFCLIGGANPTRVAVGSGSCTSPSTTSNAWADPTTAIASGDAAEAGIFKCVP